ncbi:MAG: DNA topoisomerase 3 [Schwartzia sp.]|nr:DNA topoisomerase 3 [Schwartzia sp. (in: firmicutes)]
MRLYIAEKPSMGREIAKCLPGPARSGDGFIETGGGVVTWCFGHILRQAEPGEYDEKYLKWRAEDLPIVPESWRLLVDKSCARQFAIVKGLIAKADEIVHAGDPDREGQLLVDEVLDYVGNTKPVRRILLNALDEKSIREANADLRDNRDFLPLKESALARSRADWLIGMNLSRAYTLAARRAGHDLTLPVGRVKTPTLALVVRREREIKGFHPVAYYTIKANFRHANGSFSAVWKPADDQPGLDSEGRLTDRQQAEAKLALFEAGGDGVINEYSKAKKSEPPPLPFSLSSLQVLAGRRFGYEPQQVLDTAQQLYEKKLTSYPRSDCEYLPKNQLPAAKTILANLSAIGDETLSAWAKGADITLKSRAWNDSKITAHHAIIPTTVRVRLETLTEMQRNLYFLIARGYLAQFYPLHLYDQTKVGVLYAGEQFNASGRTVRDMGWKALYSGKQAAETEEKDEEAAALPPMKKGDKAAYDGGRLDEKQTKPPQRFTPSTLLAAMKDIHKFVKDPATKKKLRDVSGIGTEATRASIIEDLIKRRFLKTEGKKKILSPQPSAELLIDALPEEMTLPDKTAVWEDELHSMAAGQGAIENFLREQADFARRLCEAARHTEMAAGELPAGTYRCPRCQKGILTKRHGKNGDFWGCSAFPQCRMTCDDKNGAPDMDQAKAKTRGRSSFSPGRAAAPRPAYAPRAAGTAPRSAAAMPVAFDDFAPLSDEEMAAFTASYQPDLSASAYAARVPKKPPVWRDKPRYSAAPMEKLRSDAPRSDILCPRCREGHLRLIHGKNGQFWGCSNYPHCTATFDDNKGTPVLRPD